MTEGAPPPLVIVITGPSGVGKDTVVARLTNSELRKRSLVERLRALDLPLHVVVTATNRPPRPGERDGVDYIFLSDEEFDRKLAEGGFLEHAEVYGQKKGVPRDQVERALAEGKDVLLRVDPQGAATIKRLIPEAVVIFILPGTMTELEQRIRARGGDTEEDIQRRLQEAAREIGSLAGFDYAVVNEEGKLDQTVSRIAAIIYAEKARPGRPWPRIRAPQELA
ncbi:MAG TPA: guanylate kinase [Dehalococcoidia bacterium]|nr:guanylate kinase [Dehalococcoidia bacterium]